MVLSTGLFLTLIWSHLFIFVWGHARLMSPPSRSSMWRLGFPTKKNFNDNGLYCGGMNVQWNQNKGKCGICGDAYHLSHPRENEAGGKYASGIISKTYLSGQVIDAVVDVTTNHKGHFEFKICPNNNPKKEATQECLDKYILKQLNGEYKIDISGKGRGNITSQLQLPKGLTCSQCVLQWTYVAGNNWGRCEDGTSKVGCGPQETFRGCADIGIQKFYNTPKTNKNNLIYKTHYDSMKDKLSKSSVFSKYSKSTIKTSKPTTIKESHQTTSTPTNTLPNSNLLFKNLAEFKTPVDSPKGSIWKVFNYSDFLDVDSLPYFNTNNFLFSKYLDGSLKDFDLRNGYYILSEPNSLLDEIKSKSKSSSKDQKSLDGSLKDFNLRNGYYILSEPNSILDEIKSNSKSSAKDQKSLDGSLKDFNLRNGYYILSEPNSILDEIKSNSKSSAKDQKSLDGSLKDFDLRNGYYILSEPNSLLDEFKSKSKSSAKDQKSQTFNKSGSKNPTNIPLLYISSFDKDSLSQTNENEGFNVGGRKYKDFWFL